MTVGFTSGTLRANYSILTDTQNKIINMLPYKYAPKGPKDTVYVSKKGFCRLLHPTPSQ